MAKCPICGSRKGKRKCLVKAGPICTLCCGETREEETCRGCPFYHFQDESLVFDNDLIERAFHYVNDVIMEDLSTVPRYKLVRILAVIRFVANRRSKGNREYLEIINEYVGTRIAPGLRIVPMSEDLL